MDLLWGLAPICYRTHAYCRATRQANQFRVRVLERRRADPVRPNVAQTRGPGPVAANSEQKREGSRSQKHQEQAQQIPEPPHDPALGSRLRLLSGGARLASARE